MSRSLHLLRGAAGATALTLAAVLTACTGGDHTVLGPTTLPNNGLFASYVSLGNSITAGYQSGGINDSTQRAAYPVLLARTMATSFVYPSLNMPGCPPPIANFQTGARVGGTTAPPCALRNPAFVSDRVNNVAVPGATSFDPTAPLGTSASNALTTFILGGMDQVDRALQAKPTFASVWIGNNDVLVPALTGFPSPTPPYSPGATPLATFVTNYASTINKLTTGAPGLKGILIGVVQVSGAPQLTRGAVIAASPQLQGALAAAVGAPVTVLPNCTGSASLVNLIQLIPLMKAYVASGGTAPQEHPPIISCEKLPPPSAPVGDIFVLDSQEQATLGGIINSYNAYIKAKADSIGFAYYDPNPLLASWIASGAIPPAPNFASPTQPFGQYVSLDGVHPSSAAHIALANQMIDAINAKFGTNLKAVQ